MGLGDWKIRLERPEKQEKTWAGAFIVVSSGRIGKGGFAGLALAGLNNFSGSGTEYLSLVVWTWHWVVRAG